MNSWKLFLRNAGRRTLVAGVCAFALPVFAEFPTNSLWRVPSLQISIGVSPLTGFVGMTQYVFINGCLRWGPIAYATAYVDGTLTVPVGGIQSPCYFPIGVLEIGPKTLGVGHVILSSPSGVVAEIATQVLVPSKSRVEIDGMWYDDATNGSGISFFQSTRDGAAFGTWFLYASAPIASARSSDTPRWYSLQNTAWTGDGSVLEGTIFEVIADSSGSMTPCAVGTECPRRFNVATPVGSFRFVVSGTDRGRIDAFDTTGNPVFFSNLRRLQF